MTILGQPVANNQVRSGHQGGVDSGNINPLYIDQYGGEVEHRFLKDSMMRKFFKFKSIRGTDTVTNDRIGHTQLQKVTRGTRPTDHAPTFDNISVKVDTIVLARTNTFKLDDFLSHIDQRKEVGIEHGKTIGKFFDESFINQGIKACQITNQVPTKNAAGDVTGSENVGGWADVVDLSAASDATVPDPIVRTAPEGFQGGTAVVMGADGDDVDPDLLVKAVQRMAQNIEEKDMDLMEGVLLMRPKHYYALLNSDKLLDRDFSDANGDFSQGTVMKVNGLRIMKTNRFPKQGDVGQEHFLSNSGNQNAYDVNQADVNCIALFLMPKALLAGEAIPLTSDVYFFKPEFQWFIDSFLSYAVTPNRAEQAAGIFVRSVTEDNS